MKTINLATNIPTLTEILTLATEDTVMIKTTTGQEFILAEVDDFSQEIELVSQNEELMEFLKQRSQETKRYTLDQVKEIIN